MSSLRIGQLLSTLNIALQLVRYLVKTSMRIIVLLRRRDFMHIQYNKFHYIGELSMNW